MKTALIALLLLIFLYPHIIHSAPVSNPTIQTNGHSSDAYQMKWRQDQRKELKIDLQTTIPKSTRSPSAIPCPNPFMTDENPLKNISRGESDTTTCPQDGEMHKQPLPDSITK